MNIRQLEYFLAVAETSNFTRAAEKYYISQTAVTQQIQNLEKQLNVKLFNRTNRHVELTPAGKIFVNEAKEIINRTKEAIEKTQLASTGFSGTLDIGFVKGYEKTSFPRLIQSFHSTFPNIALSFESDDIAELYEGLLDNKYDVIFNIFFNTDEYNNLNYKLVKKYPLFAILYPNHQLARHSTIKRENLKDEFFIVNELFSNDHDYSKNIMDTYINAGFMPNIIRQSRDLETILLMVSAGMGIAVLPEYTINTLSNSMNLVFIPLDGDNEYVELGAIWNKDNENPSLTKFLESF